MRLMLYLRVTFCGEHRHLLTYDSLRDSIHDVVYASLNHIKACDIYRGSLFSGLIKSKTAFLPQTPSWFCAIFFAGRGMRTLSSSSLLDRCVGPMAINARRPPIRNFYRYDQGLDYVFDSIHMYASILSGKKKLGSHSQ